MKKPTFIFLAVLLIFATGCKEKPQPTGLLMPEDEKTTVESSDSLPFATESSVKEQDSASDVPGTDSATEAEYYSPDDYYAEGSDYYEGGEYADGGYDDGYGETGYGVTGFYDNGYGGYLCEYGSYYAKTNEGLTYASATVYNADGAMTADIYFYDVQTGDTLASAFVYTNATDAFGDAINDTEVEMSVALDDPNFYYNDPSVAGGHLDVIVYYPMSKCYVKLVTGSGKTYEANLYP